MRINDFSNIYNFSNFQNVINNNPPTREHHYDALLKKIDM